MDEFIVIGIFVSTEHSFLSVLSNVTSEFITLKLIVSP